MYAPRPALVRAVRIAACKAAAADCKPNMAKFEPVIADCRCRLPIGNCQVLCIFMYMWIEASAHADRGLGGGGSMRILVLVVIKPNTIAEKFTTQRHSQRQ